MPLSNLTGLERLAIRTTQNMTPAGTTHYLYDLAGHLLVEADDTGQTLREYVWLDDMPLAVVADVDTMSPNLYFVHADHLNTPVRMTDNSKSVVWDAFFLAFGTVELITGSASNNLRFPGQYFLIELGLHYNWYRHYDPTLGRYVQPDPLEFEDGPSIYAYARSRPQEFTDSEGQLAQLCLANPILCGTIARKTIELCLTTAAGIIATMAEHTKGKRPSTEQEHEKGQARKKSDQGGEKADWPDGSRYPPSKRPKGYKGKWPPED